MTRIACKLGLVAAVVIGVFALTAAPADAHPHGGFVFVAPRVVVPAYYAPPVVYAAPAPVVVRPV